MRSVDRRRRLKRNTQLETLEERAVMSASPLGGLLGGSIQQHALQDDAAETSALPPLMPHQGIQHHQSSGLENISHHTEQPADFWIDNSLDYDLEQHLQEIQQTLASAHNQTGLTQVRTDYGFTGGGQTVAVIDSGIAYTHYALGGGYGSNYRVVGGHDFTESGAGALDPYDDGPEGGHGTHVAGIVGADAGSNSGVAPEVDLVGLRVFDDAGNGYFSWVEQALDWIHVNRNAFANPITAVNLSLGTQYNSDTIPNWAMLEDEFAQLEADGIFISVSAGNSFQDYNTPGLSYPAASSYVIPVMSTDDDGSLSYFSQRHQRAIAAPGRWITSTVPDYAAGDADTIDDDFSTWSGTSMAAPYVAGASVLIREAMQFVGYTNITQDTIYDHIVATADQFFDSATGLNYNRLNLEAAIDVLMPTDDYGNSIATAFSLGTLNGESSLNGLVGTLDDEDFFSFTAGITGTVEFTAAATHDLAVSWSGNGVVSGSLGEVFTLDVVAGDTYTVGLSSSDGIGYFDLAIDAQSNFTFTEWGTVGFTSYADVVNSGESWYHIAAGQNGYLTAQAFFNEAAGDISLTLFDGNLQQVAAGSGQTNEDRLDVTANAGDEFYLRVAGTNSNIDFQLTNLVSFSSGTVQVNGTIGADTFAFTAGQTHVVSVNDVSYSFAAAAVTTIQFDGGSGNDLVTVIGSAANETVNLRAGSFDGSGGGYAISGTSLETIVVHSGGGADVANFEDTAGADTFSTWGGDRARMYGSNYANEVRSFARANATSTTGFDRAFFEDTSGSDTYISWASDRAVMYGAGYFNQATGFRYTVGYASTGYDRAFFLDGAGNDTYIAYADQRAFMYGDGYFNDAHGFARTYATATSGFDRAFFEDSAGSDTYSASGRDYARMYGDGYANEVSGFARTYATATTGFDRAYFEDTDGHDTYTASGKNYAKMYGDAYANEANGFARTYAYATVGYDRAYFSDTAGNDVYVASGKSYARMYGDGYANEVNGFRLSFAYATTGYDRAFFLDTVGNDQFQAWTNSASMSGSGYQNNADGFRLKYAYSTAGSDTAKLYDSGNDDDVHAETWGAYMAGAYYRNEVHDFDSVDAHSENGGSDEAFVNSADYLFNLIGNWS